MNDNGSWNEYQKLVLAELKRNTADINEIKSDQSKILSEIAVLKVKAGMWGAVSGAISAVGGAILYYLGFDSPVKH